MRSLHAAPGSLFLVFAFVTSANAAELFHLDTFNDSTNTLGWSGSSVSVEVNSGTGGMGDNTLRVTSDGGFGPGSNLAAHNELPVWRGNYSMAGVTAVQADFRNSATGSSPLNMRLVLFQNSNNRWMSTNGFLLPNDGNWYTATFPVSSADLTRVLGNISYDSLMSNVTSVMFRHNTSLTSGGTAVVARLNIDNILLLGAQEVFPDANGDNMADASDFNIWNANKNRTGTDVTTGDFNGDQTTDELDLAIWNEHRFTANPNPASSTAVPEPTAGVLFTLAFGSLLAFRRPTAQ